MGGSFNPVHAGHLAVADHVKRQAGLDRVLLMLSPLNPLKAGSSDLISDTHRFEMLKIACQPYIDIEACDLELTMPQPSYTINTLRRLQDLLGHDAEISLIIGEDNWRLFDRWLAHDEILRDYKVIVYPRNRVDGVSSIEVSNEAQPQIIAAPTVDVSSTQIREAIALGRDVNKYLPEGVFQYIKDNSLYGYNS